jgi:hypothetical protein
MPEASDLGIPDPLKLSEQLMVQANGTAKGLELNNAVI